MHLLAISPGDGADPVRWRKILSAGIDGLMIREKHLEARALLDLVRWCQDEAPELPIWVNGRLDVALAAGCGLHAPECYPEIPPGFLPLSRPIHDRGQLEARLGCAQLILSPIFPVPGKGPAWGVETLHAALDALPSTSCCMLALGGIQPESVGGLKHPRLGGVALIRALWGSGDPAGAVERLREAWRSSSCSGI